MSIKINTSNYGQLPPSMSRRSFLKGTAAVRSGARRRRRHGRHARAGAGHGPAVFSFWPWGSEIVTSNADLFMAEQNEQVDLQPIPGDYAGGAGDQARLRRCSRHVLCPARPGFALARRRLDQAGRRHAGAGADPQRDDPRPRSGHHRLQRRLSRPHLLQRRAVLHLPQPQASGGVGVRGDRQRQRLSADLGRGGEHLPRDEGQGHLRRADPAGLVQRLVGHALGADRAVLLGGRVFRRRRPERRPTATTRRSSRCSPTGNSGGTRG